MSPFIFNNMLRITEQRAGCNRDRGAWCPAVGTPLESDALSLFICHGSFPPSDIGNESVPIESGYAAAVRTEPEYPPAILKNNGDNGRDKPVCNGVGLHLLRMGGRHRCEQDETDYPNRCMN